ncbi:MAG: DUF2752 domain-containing protein [Ferruginibacter sp.]|nr:DUF2752 domain-containing protein [Ferruginibacter sp.]
MVTKNRLYIWILLACSAGYAWLFWVGEHLRSGTKTFDVCLIKHALHIPCPSCGASRSALSFLHGDFFNALYLNPLGIIIGFILIITPFWVAMDYMFRKETFLNFYLKSEHFIKRPSIAIILTLLVLSNWVWNYSKGL